MRLRDYVKYAVWKRSKLMICLWLLARTIIIRSRFLEPRRLRCWAFHTHVPRINFKTTYFDLQFYCERCDLWM